MRNTEEYTFESFILDPESNGRAPEMCMAACDQPMTAFPLVLNGPNGCGKTHLLQAMRNYIESKTKSARYLSCKELIDDLVHCLHQNGNCDGFCEKYLRYDGLLIDDCHFLAGREATQEEILRLVSKFHMQGKMVALAFDGAIENYDRIISELKANYKTFVLVKIGLPSAHMKRTYFSNLCAEMNISLGDAEMDQLLKQGDFTTLPQIKGGINQFQFENILSCK